MTLENIPSLNELAVSSLMNLVIVNCESFSRTSRIFWPSLRMTSAEKCAPKVSLATVLSVNKLGGRVLSLSQVEQLEMTSSMTLA